MIYEAIYKLTPEIKDDLAALRAAWQSEHAGYYARHISLIFISNEMSYHTMQSSLRNQECPSEGLQANAGYCDGEYYGAEAPEGSFRWLTSGGNLTRYDIDEQAHTVRVLLIGARHGLRMPPNSIQNAKALKVIKYKSWRTDQSPFSAGLNPHKEIDSWSIAQKVRWLVANTELKAVELWKDTEKTQQYFAEQYRV